MKATELRIGNLLSVENKGGGQSPATVLELRATTAQMGSAIPEDDRIPEDDFEIDYEYSELNPIPLTEEWLTKFGFKIDSDGDYSLGDVCLTRNSDGELKLYMAMGHIAPPLKFVHQLQNLFFALTGKELELKTTTRV